MKRSGSLRGKLMLQYAAVVFFSAALVWGGALWASQATFHTYLIHQRWGVATSLEVVLAEHYARHGSWDGVEAILGVPARRGKGVVGGNERGGAFGQPSFRAVLYDADGSVVFDGYPEGGPLPDDGYARSADIVVEQGKVGAVLVTGAGSGVAQGLEEEYLTRFRTALSLVVLGSLGLAALLGLRLSEGIAKPIVRLRDLAADVARGSFPQMADSETSRAPIEIRQLVASFNSMAGDLETEKERKRELLRDLSHELRTPLTILGGNLEAISSGAIQLDDETLSSMIEEVSRLGNLAKDLNLLEDSSSNNAAPGLAEPLAVVERAVSSVRGAWLAKAVEIEKLVEPNLPAVGADPEKIQQVFANLLNNAFRYVPGGGKVVVSAALDSVGHSQSLTHVVFSVRDSGPGFAEEHLDKAFDRFFRGDASRSRLTGGSGLGLSIAKELVEGWGGSIWAENHKDGGAVVSFTAPVVQNRDGDAKGTT